MSNHTILTRTGSFSARSASATRTRMTLDAALSTAPRLSEPSASRAAS